MAKHADTTRRVPIVVAMLATVMLMLLVSAYFGAYFLRCEHNFQITYPAPQPTFVRVFPTDWEASLFVPAARLEGLILGHWVSNISSWQLVSPQRPSQFPQPPPPNNNVPPRSD